MSWRARLVPERVTLPWLIELSKRGPWTETAALLARLSPALTSAASPAPALCSAVVEQLYEELQQRQVPRLSDFDDAVLTESASAALKRSLGGIPDEGPALRIALVGGFSSGKSSLLNALVGLGERLPAEVEPTTACITELHSGTSEDCDQELPDGSWAPLPSSDLARTLRGRSPLSPRRVRICLDHPLLQELVLVDTPGVGSEHPEHLQRVDEELGRCDAALLICDATRAGSEDEAQLLERLARINGRTWIVLTMVDKVRVRRRGPSREEQLRELEHDIRRRFPGNLEGVVRCSAKGSSTDTLGVEHVRRVLEGLHAERHLRRARAQKARRRQQREVRSKVAAQVAAEQHARGNEAVSALLEGVCADWREELRVLRLKSTPVPLPSADTVAPVLKWLGSARGKDLSVYLDCIHILDSHEYILRSPAGVTWRRFLLDLARLCGTPPRWTVVKSSAATTLHEVLLSGDMTLPIELTAFFAAACTPDEVWKPTPCAGLPWSGATLGELLRARRRRWVERLCGGWWIPQAHRAQLQSAHDAVLQVSTGRVRAAGASSKPSPMPLLDVLRPADQLSLRPLASWAARILARRAGGLAVVVIPACWLASAIPEALQGRGPLGEALEGVIDESEWTGTVADVLSDLETHGTTLWDAAEQSEAARAASNALEKAKVAVTHLRSQVARAWGQRGNLELACDGTPEDAVCGHAVRMAEAERLLGTRFLGGPRVPPKPPAHSCAPLPDMQSVLGCVTFEEATHMADAMPGWRLPDVDEARTVASGLPEETDSVRAFWTRTSGRGGTYLVAERNQDPWHLATTTRIETIGVMLVRDDSAPEP